MARFCVKGRNCALDVCWEGKNFRVTCSRLNSSSVMHLCVKDLGDLRSLVTSRGSEMHVHICVDAQTGLTKAILCKHWHCDDCLTSCRKKQCWRVLSWPICSQPQTLSFVRMTVPQTSTPALKTGTTNLNRLIASFHLTPVCVPGPSTRRPQTRITGD